MDTYILQYLRAQPTGGDGICIICICICIYTFLVLVVVALDGVACVSMGW